jgi:hypothetical protein
MRFKSGWEKKENIACGKQNDKSILLVALRFIMVHLEWFSWSKDNMIDGAYCTRS